MFVRIIVFLQLVSLFTLTGCAQWTYNNVPYDSSSSALIAARQDINNSVDGVQRLEKPFDLTARIIVPSLPRIKDAGVVKTGAATDEQVTYVAKVLEYGFLGFSEAIQRRNIFSNMQIVRQYNTEHPSQKDEDYLIWLFLTDQGGAQWFLRNKNDTENKIISIDQSKVSTSKVISFLESIESHISYPLKNNKSKAKQAIKTGTGFIVSRNGHILTNAHVVKDCSTLTADFEENTESLTLISMDSENDLAILKSNVLSEHIAYFSHTATPALGQELIVSGYPLSGLLSDQIQLTTGVLSATSGINNDFRYFQLTAPVQQGNSGGPVLNNKGEVIGVVVSKLNAGFIQRATGDIPQNVNFAIKAAIAKIFMHAYKIKYLESDSKQKMSTQEIGQTVGKYTLRITCTMKN